MWDNSSRAELFDFLETQCSQRESQHFSDVQFTYSSHVNELVIGNVFIRLYNNQPAFPIKVTFLCSLNNSVFISVLKFKLPFNGRRFDKQGQVFYLLNLL